MQTYREIEIIVVDDGSSDKSAEIASSYTPNLILIEQVNQGTQAARNTGIRASSGEYIALLDSDDMWLSHKLERQVVFLESRSDIGLVYSLAHIMDEEGKITQGALIGSALSDSEPALQQLLVEDSIPALTAVFRRSFIGQVGFFDESLSGAGDHDMWLRIAASSGVACIPEPLAIYREHEFNTTKLLQKNKGLSDERWRVLEKAKSYFQIGIDTLPIWNKAIASAHLINAEAEAYSGDAPVAGSHLAKALELDPSLYNAHDELVGLLVHWIDLICGSRRTGRRYRQFTNELCSQVPRTFKLMRLKRSVLSTAAMRTVFTSYCKEDFDTVRSVLPVGIWSAPRWLLNRGVWSIMADAYLGQKMTSDLRNTFRRLSD
jgi:glycosyltransferase involved in cell wall biosynthesis